MRAIRRVLNNSQIQICNKVSAHMVLRSINFVMIRYIKSATLPETENKFLFLFFFMNFSKRTYCYLTL